MNKILRARTPRRDVDLKRDVLAEVARERHPRSDCVSVSVRQGSVVLSGRISSREALHGIEAAARRVPGVTSVSSEFTVTAEGPPGRDGDPRIAGAVHRALHRNRLLVGTAITPTVEGGWVDLKGIAEFSYQPAAAVAAINRLPGVRGVTNRIRTIESAPPAVDTTCLLVLGRKRLMEAGTASVTPAAADRVDGAGGIPAGRHVQRLAVFGESVGRR